MHIKQIRALIISGLLLFTLILPQLALADEPGYSLSLSPNCGYCDDQIRVTATVAADGIYRICWDCPDEDLCKPEHAEEIFTADAAGNYTMELTVPRTERGDYIVYLTRENYTPLATADFEVLISVDITPEWGPEGEEVTISGCGFEKLQPIRVNLYQGGVAKGTVETGTANDLSSWTIFYKIPETPSGDYYFKIEFEDDDVWYDLAGRYFEVTPKITAPSSGKVGQTIEVSGTGFQSKERDIEITLDGEVVEPTIPVEVKENGSWSAVIVIPPIPRGDHDIAASGKETRARDVDYVTFTVGAGILVEPISASVGDQVKVKGGGFGAKERGIKVYFDGLVVTPTTITADADGCWEHPFTLPHSTYGRHDIKASGDIIQDAVETTLDIKARIEEPSVSYGYPGDSVTLTGSGFSNYEKLTVRISGITAPGEDGEPLDERTRTNGDVNITFRVPKMSTYGERVLEVIDDGGASDSVEFTVKRKTLSAIPLPISPNGSTLRSGEVTFKWQGSTGNTGYTYTLEISETADFTTTTNPPYEGIPGSSKTLTEEEALDKGTYYWRIKIVDDYGNESPWSDSVEFRVSPIPTWVWVVVGVVVLVGLMVVAYRETKFKVTE